MRRLYFLLIILTAACTRHPRLALPGTRYRIIELDGRALTLAPPVAELAAAKPLQIQFPITLGPHSAAKSCTEQNDLFRVSIDPKSRQLSLTMPSLTDWRQKLPEWDQPDRRDLELKIESMLAAPEALESRGCLSAGSALELRQLLRGAIPAPPGADLYPAYGYRPGGLGLDLKSGVRLKIQRAHFTGKPSVQNLIGVTTVYFEARTGAHQRTAFAPPSIQRDPFKGNTLPRTAVHEDLRFAHLAKPQPLYRLFFLTSFPQKGLRRTAVVLGAPSISAMESMQQKISANPAIACAELTRGTASTCISFDGDVSVSAEVAVTINGVRTFLDWGSNVRSVLRKSGAEAAAAPGLKLRRIFEGKLMPVEIDPKLTGSLENTVLIAGDELSWK